MEPSTCGKDRKEKKDEKPGHEEETNLSGTYLRRVVKQDGASLTIEAAGSRAKRGIRGEAGSPPRKQTRRRVHISKPYQERIINMAEARKEIVTALKFHRASMKRATQLQEQQRHHLKYTPPSENHGQKNVQGESLFNSISSGYAPALCPPFSLCYNDVALLMPCRPLGLDLNLEGFSHQRRGRSISGSEEGMKCQSDDKGGAGAEVELHRSVDEEEMARIKSIGEQHDMEWNDKLNSMTSAWWSRFLQAAEAGPNCEGKVDTPFYFPSWLSDVQESYDEQYFLQMEHAKDNPSPR
ncbi:protein AAL-toxin resistant 7-like [Wolffia australiana]